MALSSTGELVSSVSNIDLLVSVTRPTFPIDSWTHVTSNYSATRGIRFYINGTLVGSANAFADYASGIPMTLMVGNSVNGSNCTCVTGLAPYRGLMDDCRLYARELSAANRCLLANP